MIWSIGKTGYHETRFLNGSNGLAIRPWRAHALAGLGFVVLDAGTLKWRLLPNTLGIFAVILGLVAMAITMAFSDNLEYYGPLFHLNVLWFTATGIVVLRKGVRVEGEIR